MAISGMTSENQHPVGAGLKGLQNKLRFNPSGAHHPDNFYIRSIGFPLTACGVGAAVGTPIAQKTHDFRFKVLYFKTSSISAKIC
jgi:hypothetical protein